MNGSTNMNDHDWDFEDPKMIDDLLAKEMLLMTAKERNDIHEEIHCVSCLSPVETPKFLAKCLDDLALEIDKIPASQKQAYLLSQRLPSSHVHSKSFRMRFLRASKFTIPLVARRLVSWLDIALQLFGKFVLQRPIRMGDFSRKEIMFLRMGYIQFLPFGDRSGRRIMIMFPDEVFESIPALSKARIQMYMSWTAANDIDSQKRGLVVIIWFDQTFKVSRKPTHKYRLHQIFSIRCSAMHVCSPDTSFYYFRRAVVAMRAGRARRRLRQHLGNSIENLYALRSYGIPVDRMPISFTGKIKVNYIRQWIHVRSHIENFSNNHRLWEKMIEYPKSNDIVFRKGKSCIIHPANESFRDLVMSKVKEQVQLKKTCGIKIRRKEMVMDIMREIQVKDGARFLIWTDDGGWYELRDEDAIISKIEYLIKEFRKSVRVTPKSHQKTIPGADTSMFLFRPNIDAARHNHSIPQHSQHKADDSQQAEAASCIAECFNMDRTQHVQSMRFSLQQSTSIE